MAVTPGAFLPPVLQQAAAFLKGRAGLRVTKDKTKDVKDAMHHLTLKKVMVGIPAQKASRPGTPINNAALGYIHEHGSPARNIPARPWLVPGTRQAQKDYLPHLKKAAELAMSGDKHSVDVELHSAGIVAVSGVKLYFNTANFVPLRPSTLAARRRAGFLGTRPLVRTGQLRNAINYVLRGAGA